MSEANPLLAIHVNGSSGYNYIHNYNYFNLNGGGRPCMLNASTLISVQAIIMSVHTHVQVFTYSVKTV